MKNKINGKIIHQILFLTVIVVLFVLIMSRLSLFFPSFLGAVTLYALSRNFFLYLTEKRHWNIWIVTFVIFLLSIAVISAPVYMLVELTHSRVHTFISYMQNINDYLVKVLNQLKWNYGINLQSKENITQFTTWAGKIIPEILNSTLNSVLVFFFSFFIFFFMIMNVRKMESVLMKWSPLKDKNTRILGVKLTKMIQSNAIGIPAVALIQGIAGLIGYTIAGIDNLWFWFAVTTFAAMIPIVGSALAYVPMAIILFSTGHVWTAVFILLYGLIVIGSVDNIARFTLLKKLSDTHPLITIFGVIFGMSLFGFLGLIFGPILISLFFLLIEVYADEFGNRKRRLKYKQISDERRKHKPDKPTESL
ncbi:MAG: AI-2E family transporter [Flavobacteriaceae bacterium]|jgi:predicted PurR-regulated permease PerM|nr:AI-2E family transporter [Flavobacteriaceae bacterium]